MLGRKNLAFWLCLAALLIPALCLASEAQAPYRPLVEPRFPSPDNGATVSTSLQLDFPKLKNMAQGPKLSEARQAALSLPFSFALISDLESYGLKTAVSVPLYLHGAYRQGQPAALLSGSGSETCGAATGQALQAENAYGTSFAATRLEPGAGCRESGQWFLAAVGLEQPAYEPLAPSPLKSRKLTKKLAAQVKKRPELFLASYDPEGKLKALPLQRIERLEVDGTASFILTYGEKAAEQPRALVWLRNGKAQEFWLGCGAQARFFKLQDKTFLAYSYQHCEAGRRALYVYLLNADPPLPVYVNLDFSG